MITAARQGRPNTPAAEFFAAVEDVFESAARRCGGTHARYFRLAGLELELRFAGDALVRPMTRALEHRSVGAMPGGTADTTILLWDVASTGARLPPTPWRLEDYGPFSKVEAFTDELIHTCFQVDTGSLLLFHAERNLAVYCTLDASTLAIYESAAPLRTILHWSMRRRGRQLVHAGAVGRAAGAVLLAGDSGSGKSSTALTCLQSDLLYAGDDYCAVELGVTPRVHSLYSTGKVEGGALARLPFLEPMVANRAQLDREKAVFFLHEQVPSKLLADAPIRALALPKVTSGRDTTTSPASPFDALVAFAPSTHAQLPYAGDEVLTNLAELVRRVPAFHLKLGSDATQIAPALERLLDAVG